MEYILVAIVFLFIGLCLMYLISASKIEDLQRKINQRNKLIEKQTKDIKNYCKIKRIITIDEINNEFAVFTVDKIKEVINDSKSTNNF